MGGMKTKRHHRSGHSKYPHPTTTPNQKTVRCAQTFTTSIAKKVNVLTAATVAGRLGFGPSSGCSSSWSPSRWPGSSESAE